FFWLAYFSEKSSSFYGRVTCRISEINIEYLESLFRMIETNGNE
ncbi:MAG: hypothetical protein ACI89U_003270, partial [Gammaproteobacteria bacterium]